MEGLIEGRIVHYVAYNQRHLAAIIIGISDLAGIVDIALFTNMQNVNGDKNFGLQFHQDVKHSDEKEPGTWHWTEKT